MDETALIAAAIAAMDAAYAPYSRFAVGAALYDERAQIHRGANVENAAYPQGSCAEAAAITAMILGGGKRITAIAIAAVRGIRQGAGICSAHPSAHHVAVVVSASANSPPPTHRFSLLIRKSCARASLWTNYCPIVSDLTIYEYLGDVAQ